jgi:7-cyano-7-deazaguanine synthase
MKALAILSGGLDSATAFRLARERGITIEQAVWFNYGQRHFIEWGRALMLANHFDVELKHVELPRVFASNQLSDSSKTPRQDASMSEITEGVAPTFVPGRNMVMLALAASYAVSQECTAVVGGWHWSDSSGYPDCRASFLMSMQSTINEALGVVNFEIVAPLISLNKNQIVSHAIRLCVPVRDTWSCYNPVDSDGVMLFYDAKACGKCDSCQLRIKGFKDAGFIDPINYAIPIDWTGCDPLQERLL